MQKKKKGLWGYKMKIVEWLKNLINRITKKENLLSETNETNKNDEKNRFVQKVVVKQKYEKTREDILRDVKREIILKALANPENYTSFKEDIKSEYDKEDILSKEDMEALECIYRAIREGNVEVCSSFENRISMFLKQESTNIVILVNRMIEDAKNMYKKVQLHDGDSKDLENLIADSYNELVEIIEQIEEKQKEEKRKIEEEYL